MNELSDIEFAKELFLRCDDCEECKEDVEDTFCPYTAEIYDKEVPITVCGDCYKERAWDI